MMVRSTYALCHFNLIFTAMLLDSDEFTLVDSGSLRVRPRMFGRNRIHGQNRNKRWNSRNNRDR